MMKNSRAVKKILRKRETPAEARFWGAVRNRQFLNLRFIRQYSIEYILNGKTQFFIVDFYCDKLKLVVEIDGPIHLDQKEKDKSRSEIIAQKGYSIIRFTNRDIIKNLSKSLNQISQATRKQTPPLFE